MADRIEGFFHMYYDGGEYRWTKYKSYRKEDVLAKSSEGYTNKSDRDANAERFGYNGEWTGVHTDNWEFFTDSASLERWRRKASNGRIVGASHQGYLTASRAKTNAERNGYEG